MSVFHYLVFLSLVVISLCKNLTCKFGDGNETTNCTGVDYCTKYMMINSTVHYGRGCDVRDYCTAYDIGNNECRCDLKLGDPTNSTKVMMCCCDTDNCDVSSNNYCSFNDLPTPKPTSSAVGLKSTFLTTLMLFISFI